MSRLPLWLVSIFFLLILIQTVMGIADLHFISSIANRIYWLLIAIVGTILIGKMLKQPGKTILVFVAVLFYTCWLIILYSVSYDTSIPESFVNCPQKVWIQEKHTIHGTNGKYVVRLGKTYLGNTLFLEESHFSWDFYNINTDYKKYVIPKETSFKECVIWKEKGMLFDLDHKKCYKLK